MSDTDNEWWNQFTPAAREAIDAARTDGFTFKLGPEPLMVHVIPPDTVVPRGPDGIDSGTRLHKLMSGTAAFRTAAMVALRADGVPEEEQQFVDGDVWPVSDVMQVKLDRPDIAEQVEKIKVFMAECYPDLPFLWEGEYISMADIRVFYAVAYSCKDLATFDTLEAIEFYEMGRLVDNIDYD